MNKYNSLKEYIAAEVDTIEDDYEFSQAEYDGIKQWFYERGFSSADREFALARGYDENIEYWEEQKNGEID